MIFQVGITGGIGSGKTLVCRVFEKLGIPVYYADSRARWLMNHEPALIEGIQQLLGAESYRGGELQGEYVADRVFRDPEMLNRLNGIVHPAVRNHYIQWVNNQDDADYVIEEAAILFESGAYRFLDYNVLVFAPEELRIRRVMDRDGVSEEEVRLRMKRQMKEEDKKKLADKVINNDETGMLLPQIISLHRRILKFK